MFHSLQFQQQSIFSTATLAVYSRDITTNEDGHDDEEPPFQYIPVDASPSSRSRTKCDRLLESIMLLREGLESGAIIFQFEVSVVNFEDTKVID